MAGRVLVGVLMAVTLLIAGAAVLFLLPSLKEGFDQEELPLFGGIALGLVLIALMWWKAGFKSGVAILAIPLTAYLFLTVQLIVNRVRGAYIGSRTEIVSITEQPILWPGFDGPAGIRLDIVLRASSSPHGNLLSPKIATQPMSPKDYFSGRPGMLAVPMYWFIESKASAEPKFPSGSATLSYELFPDRVSRHDGSRRVCLSEGSAPVVSSGPLSAVWFLAGPGGLTVDLSAKLTEALRLKSFLASQPGEWSRLFDRLQPDRLVSAGYSKCRPEKGEFSGEVCYCRG